MRFRLLVDEPQDAFTNMAVDEALYLSALDPPGVATVRLYRFHPFAVSFGYRQSVDEAVDTEACRSLGLDWVRRPTGGRALLHQHELTYCVTAHSGDVFGGLAVREVYDVVSDAIRRALEALGVPLDPPARWERGATGVSRREAETSAPCLSVPARHEISAGGRKLVASAQRRNPRGFLQHGAILRRVDPALWSRVAPPSLPSVPLHAVGLDELVPHVTETALVEALGSAFETTFGAPAFPGRLSPSERSLVPHLVEKYRSPAWTRRLPGASLALSPSAKFARQTGTADKSPPPHC